MLCSWCRSYKAKTVTNHIDRYNLSIVSKIYYCIYCGIFYECRKCERCEFSTIELITHVSECYKHKIPVYQRLIEIGEFNGRNVALRTSSILREIPYFFLLAIDFENAFRHFTTDKSNIHEIFDTIPESKITEFANIIKKSIPSCPFCGRYYETFPTEDIVINHCKSCKI